ncbi:hypothetical protein AtubIFM55763_001159 [Aspergillus tubingensis]|uniref:Uncharacterized protein n=1 Tax=Aspergillus tubingensis TaxID=5068 RepID=A0A8H3XWD9_ASPTU|nr:uncharacterized protein AtWU_03289 [Aspergillus tubingensis]GFN13491.1 hypothetical protein AtWU_03289 [Aspergillus tubingensis]GLA57004.1 hypothetical protein AtubIFM54640_003128 [Aspergillus tubingensis]GLA70880.1 hypothetical protein AtubIFM55763_001159 [Aspergillus tubingensis]GLA81846.1 hypothetical protein AtubIFM56815_006024 [Aspergillus tubingensis]
MDSTQSPPRRVLLLSMPRTASNLLLKILSISDQLGAITNDKGGYCFTPTYLKLIKDDLLSKPITQWTLKQALEVQGVLQQCLETLEGSSALARDEGKIFFVKEHISWLMNPATISKMLHDADTTNGDASGALMAPDYHSFFRVRVDNKYGRSKGLPPLNETVLPDGYLATWQLAFLIRHPALVFPSMYRADRALKDLYPSGDNPFEGLLSESYLKVTLTLRWTRMLYDWCVRRKGQAHPIILDASDLIHNKGSMVKFCEQTGLDPTVLKFEWESVGPEDKSSSGDGASEQDSILQKAETTMRTTLRGSSGVLKEKAPDVVDIASEAERWKHEFGDKVANFILERVHEAMPDYEYLRQRRLV